MRNAIQIAGVVDQQEADLLVGLGVEYLGFPLRLRDGREDLDEDSAARIIATLPDGVGAVAITYLDRAVSVVDLCDRIGVPWVQLHGPIATCELVRLRALRPMLKVIKSLIVRDGNLPGLLDEARRCAAHVDAFITDTFDPSTGRSGATGRRHDWAVSRELAARVSLPLILAGGLTPDNVGAAILEVQPAAVDAHTGVEGPDGRKDRRRVHDFVGAARGAFASLREQ